MRAVVAPLATLAATLVAMLLALTSFACRSAPAPKNPEELGISITGDPKTFDPLQVIEDRSDTVRYLTAGVLVRVNRATDALEPELAESWKLSEDGRSIAFHLHSGLKFSDNSSLDANDVARTLKRIIDPKEASPDADNFRSSAGDPAVTVTSPLDISIVYPAPKPNLDRLFDTLPITPRALPNAQAAKLPASAGPFFLSEYRPGEYVRLARNPNYWKHDSSGRQLPYLDSIRIDIQQNQDIELQRFLRGETHIVAKLEPTGFDRVEKEEPGAARSLGPSLDSESVWFNESPVAALPEWKRKWFRSAAFRHAVSLAINRADIARIVYFGHAHPSAGPISPANRYWFNASLTPLPFDPQTAAKMLTDDGFVLRDGVLYDRTGHAVEFSLITNAGNAPRERMAPLIQADLAKLGIKVDIVTLDFNSLVDRIVKSFDFEAVLLSIPVEVDPLESLNVWMSSGDHHAWWVSEKAPATPWEARIDELEKIVSSSGSRDARKKAFDEVQRIAVEQEPIIYLVNPDYLCAIAPNLKGTQPSVVPPQVWWNVEWLRLE